MKITFLLLILALLILIQGSVPVPTKLLIHGRSYDDNVCNGKSFTDETRIDQKCYSLSLDSMYLTNQMKGITLMYCPSVIDCSKNCFEYRTYTPDECTVTSNYTSQLFSIEKKDLDQTKAVDQRNYPYSKTCEGDYYEYTYVEGECYNLEGGFSVYGILVKDTIEIFQATNYNCKNATPVNVKLGECVENKDGTSTVYHLVQN
ncbi:hypothetical protein M0813_08008 [Anaeramoeba flamelloides]|uniref:Uncharacterized protein n=1 Tax=Anaeramoeba flamelloides TaxID=1746091 RepID=A0AAV7ZXQ5_9EUKA|nr:hypothetical protein M0812_08891 [Anaeramoeba flamelloides]KAJ6229091.1 hypothetical protein M0813_08008 [Anaeramoeba flamelloides]|eukprot:Anaeramoba_flamelloidesa93347_240.p1 GENE.a93347_240~~a93347_240.p1  ORF type:complete len:217 (-),score=34.33 a93347_240:192-800(-)